LIREARKEEKGLISPERDPFLRGIGDAVVDKW
jgi:hypothetical protein